MSFTMFSLAMLLICVLCIGAEVFKGFKGGFLQALISLSAVISSIICSIIFSRSVSRLLSYSVMAFVRNELIGGVSVIGGSISLDSVISFFIQAIVNSMIFVVLFLIFKWLFGIAFKLILNRKTKDEGRPEDSENKKDKLIGALVGCLCGIIIAAAVTAPVMGTLNLARDTVGVIDVIDDDMLESADFDSSALDTINKYASDIPGNFCYSMGGKLIYSQIAVGDFNGKLVSVVTEIKYLGVGLKNALEIVGRFSEDNISFEEEIDASGFYECLDNSEIIRTLVAESLSQFSSSWLRGESFLGISKPNFNDNIDPLVDELLAVCASTNSYNVKGMVTTLLDIFAALVECDVTADSRTEDINYTLLVQKLYEVLDQNPDMESVKRGLTDLAMGVVIDDIRERFSDGDFKHVLDRIAKETNDTFNTGGYDMESKKEILQNSLSKVFGQYGLPIDDVVADLAADKLIDMANSYGGNISASDIEALMNAVTGNENGVQ